MLYTEFIPRDTENIARADLDLSKIMWKLHRAQIDAIRSKDVVKTRGEPFITDLLAGRGRKHLQWDSTVAFGRRGGTTNPQDSQGIGKKALYNRQTPRRARTEIEIILEHKHHAIGDDSFQRFIWQRLAQSATSTLASPPLPAGRRSTFSPPNRQIHDLSEPPHRVPPTRRLREDEHDQIPVWVDEGVGPVGASV